MRGFKETILVLALGLSLPVGIQAQYIGSSRPPDRQEMLDSLAARLDTARFAADSLRLDSLATAGADKDSVLDARIDSLRDNPAGGSSGGNVALDTTIYDYILGFTTTDSMRTGGYSKFIMLAGTRTDADSSDADTLVWCIDQIKNTGGNIYICGTPADTIYWWKGASFYDSLPSSGGITADVTIDGDGLDRVIHYATDHDLMVGTADKPFGGTGGARLVWKHQQFYGVDGHMGGSAYGGWQLTAGVDFRECRFVLEAWEGNSNGADNCLVDSMVTVENCEFGTPDLSTYGGFGGLNIPYLQIRNCRGYFNASDCRSNNLTMQGCYFLAIREFNSGGSGDRNWMITGNELHFVSYGSYDGIYIGGGVGGQATITGNRFCCPNDGSVGWVLWGNALDFIMNVVNGNTFFHCGVYVGATVTGNSFYSAATGIKSTGNKVAAHSNSFYACTTGIDADSRAALITDNKFWSCTTDIANAASADTTDNYSQ